MRQGAFTITYDNFIDLAKKNFYSYWHLSDKEILFKTAIEFYAEWYDIIPTEVVAYNHPSRGNIYVKFLYKPKIKPHLTECLEYMINNLN